jgi:hypothetical protein
MCTVFQSHGIMSSSMTDMFNQFVYRNYSVFGNTRFGSGGGG